jgi:hypothetical protein
MKDSNMGGIVRKVSASYYILPDDAELTKDQAFEIRALRFDGCTWRALARHFTRAHKDFCERYRVPPDKETQMQHFGAFMSDAEKAQYTDWECGNQLLGMDLCSIAMDLLGEKVEDGWN